MRIIVAACALGLLAASLSPAHADTREPGEGRWPEVIQRGPLRVTPEEIWFYVRRCPRNVIVVSGKRFRCTGEYRNILFWPYPERYA